MSRSGVIAPLPGQILLIFLEDYTCISALESSIHRKRDNHRREGERELAAASKLLTRMRLGLSATL